MTLLLQIFALVASPFVVLFFLSAVHHRGYFRPRQRIADTLLLILLVFSCILTWDYAQSNVEIWSRYGNDSFGFAGALGTIWSDFTGYLSTLGFGLTKGIISLIEHTALSTGLADEAQMDAIFPPNVVLDQPVEWVLLGTLAGILLIVDGLTFRGRRCRWERASKRFMDTNEEELLQLDPQVENVDFHKKMIRATGNAPIPFILSTPLVLIPALAVPPLVGFVWLPAATLGFVYAFFVVIVLFGLAGFLGFSRFYQSSPIKVGILRR